MVRTRVDRYSCVEDRSRSIIWIVVSHAPGPSCGVVEGLSELGQQPSVFVVTPTNVQAEPIVGRHDDAGRYQLDFASVDVARGQWFDPVVWVIRPVWQRSFWVEGPM